MGFWKYYLPIEEGSGLYNSRFVLNLYDNSGGTPNVLSRMTLSPSSVRFENLESGETYELGKLVAGLPSSVIIKNLPTSNSQLPSGQLWRDGEFVKVVV